MAFLRRIGFVVPLFPYARRQDEKAHDHWLYILTTHNRAMNADLAGVTQWLSELDAGAPEAANVLFTLLYDELRQTA